MTKKPINVNNQLLFWPFSLCALIGFFYIFGVITIPFTIGLIFSYMLITPYKKLLKIINNRALSSFLITLVFVAIVVFFIAFFLPNLEGELVILIKMVPRCLDQLSETISPLMNSILDSLSITGKIDVRHVMVDVGADLTKNFLEFILTLFAGGGLITTGAATLVISPFVIFFVLRDSDKLLSSIKSWVPLSQVNTFNEVFLKIDKTLREYFKGQVIISIIMGIYYTTGLWILGLKTAIFMGCLSGILTLAPSIGAFVGLVIASFLGIVQFGVTPSIIVIIAIYIIGQFTEANFLVPKFIGTKIGLHPLWVFFSIYAGIALYGIIGVIISVPIAAIINLSVRFALERFKKSKIYLN